MSEREGRFALADADALVERLLHAYPREIEWSLGLQAHDRTKPPVGFNACLTVALRDLEAPWAWSATFNVYFDAEKAGDRDVIQNVRTEILLDAYDADGWLKLTSTLDRQPVAARQAKIELAFDEDREHEILDWVHAAAC